MKIDNSTVDKLADLAKLEFDAESKKEIVKDLSRVLDFVGKLNELDTENVEPLVYMTDETNVLRKDEVVQEITQQDALRNAPKKDSDYIIVPKVLQSNPEV
ncbi:MAG TPA: Asp-tRNA(Asn)/Glu-tRNA(Gln) amidotransferase subunit GatC [Flavobacteriales bacterium]|nr:Asp-tRNA(Asn)/Glu-tRNA(Gln) amidotransferase subunit GatC [Flavobacteriales bacterium]HIO67046.1 Asp-tRNA(Asn)/Glu-tRNA(Gln) amidotransferase subunit GatC [Flavobacteriales bacterium]